MIELNLDLSYLSKYYELTTQRVNQYAQKGTDNLITLETEDGKVTLDKAEFQMLMNSPAKVAKIMRLQEPKNRYLIIQNMSQDDLMQLLPYLKPEDLVWGLQYFTSDKLGELINKLPTEQVANLVFQHFSMKDILEIMPEEEMNKFFKSEKLEKEDIMKYFAQLDPEQFKKIMMQQFGPSQEKQQPEQYMKTIDSLSPDKLVEFMTNMQRKDKINMIGGLAQLNQNYILEFSNESLSKPFMKMDKTEILKTMTMLDTEFLLPMVEQLPPDLIQVIATQIDPTVFSDIIVNKFPDVISRILQG